MTTVTGSSRADFQVPALPNAVHTLTYRATDGAANSCADQTMRFTIDTTGPTTLGKRASGRVGRSVSLRYSAGDNLSATVWAPKLVIKNARGRIVKTITPAVSTSRVSGAWYSVKWKPKARGICHYHVYAKDLAGNAQSKVGSATVVVL